MYFVFSVYEKTKRGILNFTKKYNLKEAVEKAPPKVREMFEKKTLALEGETSVAKNTKILLSWFVADFYGEYEKKIGFTPQTYENKLAPGKGTCHCQFNCRVLVILN